MLSNQELLILQSTLQTDSDWVLENIQLIPLLESIGEVKITGAKALGLMIAKDIDISVFVPSVTVSDWQKLLTTLMTTPHVRKVTAIDYYNYDQINRYTVDNPQKYSLYISMDKLLGKDGDLEHPWEVQIHLLEKDSFDFTIEHDIKTKLNPEKTQTILQIKYAVDGINQELKPLTHGNFKISSPSIYDAVLNNNCLDIETFLSEYQRQVPPQYKAIFTSIVTKN